MIATPAVEHNEAYALILEVSPDGEHARPLASEVIAVVEKKKAMDMAEVLHLLA
jgi:hypothetical protein